MNNVERPSLLIISFSDLTRDARILKQIDLFADEYAVTTCGYGPSPSDQVRHVEIARREPDSVVKLRAAFIRLHLYTCAYQITPEVRASERALRGLRFDAVLANDLDTVGVALQVAPPQKIHVDLHEYWPGLCDFDAKWQRIRQPYYEWMLRHYASKAASFTTVNPAAARLYSEKFGLDCGVVANAARYRKLPPQPVHQPIRLVHSGGAQPARRIEDLMRATAHAGNFSLDLYLVGEGTPYYDSLVELARQLGPEIRVRKPVPSETLVEVLNQYDVGIHNLPPVSTNHINALPNKVYDYIQARLALVVGPTGAMAELVDSNGIGIVAGDSSVESLTNAIKSLTAKDVARFKASSNAHAQDLSAETYDPVWRDAVESIVSEGGRR